MTRSFRVHGWKEISRRLESGTLKEEIDDLISGLDDTSGVEIYFEGEDDEVAIIDVIALKFEIGPDDIPDMGLTIIGKGNPKTYPEDNE